MSVSGSFFRPEEPNQIGKSGWIDFILEVAPIPVAGFSGIYSGYNIQIQGVTAADDRAICAVLLSQSGEAAALGDFQSAIGQATLLDQQRLDPALRIQTGDILDVAIGVTSPGGGLYESCYDGRIWTYLTDDSNLIINARIDNYYGSAGYEARVANFEDQLLIKIDGAAGGGRIDTFFDPSNLQSWSQHTTEYAPDNHIIGDVFQYDTATNWFASHSLTSANLNLWQFDDAATANFLAEIERAAYHGTALIEAAPNPLSYEPYFGSAYDFGVDSYNIDFSTFPTLNSVDANLGWDFTATQYYDGWTGQYYGTQQFESLPTYTFDDWDFGDWFWPVVLDLNGDGVDITPRGDSTVFFDIDGDGYNERTAWAGPNDGLLVIDLAAGGGAGADGRIDQALEVSFANWTADPNDTDAQALASVFDTNLDGQFNAADTRWGEFRVWKDTDRDGVVDSGELQTLAALGITGIALATDQQAFLLPDGSRINGFGSFTMNGASRTYADAALAYDAQGFKRTDFYDELSGMGNIGFKYIYEDGSVKYFMDAKIWQPLPQWGWPPPATSPYQYSGITMDGIFGGSGNDQFYTNSAHAVTLYGDYGNDIIEGGSADDVLDGGPGTDTIRGGDGNDTIYFEAAEAQALSINGQAGYDTGILTSTGAITVNLANIGLEALIANLGDDNIATNAAAGAYVDGRAGNDTITGSVQDDILVGGVGNDAIRGGGGLDFLQGGAGADSIFGDAGDDVIFGGDDNDTLDGGAGNDVLNGGAGNDTMTGGDGADRFVFGAPSNGADTITDFAAGSDKFVLDRSGFGLLATGSLQAAGVSFVSGSVPQSTGPTILSSGSDFYWDPDGTGNSAPVLLAHVTELARLSYPSMAGWDVIAKGDFNADGTLDFLWKNASSGDTVEWLMSGGTVASSLPLYSASGWNVLASGDFNADGTTDILWKHPATGQTAEWLMSASGGVGDRPMLSGADGWELIATGNFNADGTKDILWKHTATGQTAEWLMSTSGGIGAGLMLSGAGGWDLIATGDFNADGTTDILWKNASTADTAEWLMSPEPVPEICTGR